MRLRPELERRKRALYDPVTSHEYPISSLLRRILRVMDGASVARIIRQMERDHGVTPRNTERELRQLFLLGLLVDGCSRAREQLSHARRAEDGPPNPRVLPGSRFACQHSGACCQGYLFGPISAAEKMRIETLQPSHTIPGLEGVDLFTEIEDGSEPPTYRLGTKGSDCVFLDTHSRCSLHTHFGAEAKPGLCRLFPLGAVATYEGIRLYDRGECATFGVSAQSGPPFDNALARLPHFPVDDLYHPWVVIHGAWRCDYSLVLQLSERLDDLAATDPCLTALYRIGQVTRGYIEALLQFPLEAGEPERTAHATLSLPPKPVPEGGAETPGVGLERLSVLARSLPERVNPSQPYSPILGSAASLLADQCLRLCEGAASRDVPDVSAHPLSEELDQILRLSLRHQLFGRDLLLDDNLEAGLLRIALALLLTLAGAQSLAATEKSRNVSVGHLNRAHMAVRRSLREFGPHALIKANGPLAWVILEAAPLLAGSLT